MVDFRLELSRYPPGPLALLELILLELPSVLLVLIPMAFRSSAAGRFMLMLMAVRSPIAGRLMLRSRENDMVVN